MDFFRSVIDVFLHLDVHLQDVITQYGTFTYVILFVIVFCETGLVILPFLPGDSLLFAAGAFAATGSLNLAILFVLFFLAGTLGDAANYAVGWFVGPKVFVENRPLLNQKKLLMAQRFYEKHGGKAIVLARFMPIMRTLAPFVAGIGRMRYREFFFYNIVGGFLWTGLFVTGGYLFGNIPLVRDHFEVVILGIIFLSLVPPVWHGYREWRQEKK